MVEIIYQDLKNKYGIVGSDNYENALKAYALIDGITRIIVIMDSSDRQIIYKISSFDYHVKNFTNVSSSHTIRIQQMIGKLMLKL